MEVSESKARFLAAYRESCRSEEGDDRLKACEEACCTWAEVEEWLARDPDFKIEYEKIWKEGFVFFQDRNRAKARKGSSTALRMELIGDDPKRYAPRLRIDAKLGGNVTIGAADANQQSGWLLEIFGARAIQMTAAHEAQALPEGEE